MISTRTGMVRRHRWHGELATNDVERNGAQRVEMEYCGDDTQSAHTRAD